MARCIFFRETFPKTAFWEKVYINPNLVKNCDVLPKLVDLKMGSTIKTQWKIRTTYNNVFAEGSRISEYINCIKLWICYIDVN